MAVATVTIYPVPGRKALMPERSFTPVPAAGAAVALNPYYATMLRVGDVTTVAPPMQPAPEAPPVAVAPEDHEPAHVLPPDAAHAPAEVPSATVLAAIHAQAVATAAHVTQAAHVSAVSPAKVVWPTYAKPAAPVVAPTPVVAPAPTSAAPAK